MEPKVTAPIHGPERANASGFNFEQASVLNPEISVDRNVEKREQAMYESTQHVPVLPQPVVLQQAALTADDSLGVSIPGAPLVANDDDLIEREWVKKAKEIIAETKDDPYRREQEIGRLQADYLLKRYGKEMDVSQ